MSEHEEFVRSVAARIEEAKHRPLEDGRLHYIVILLGGEGYAVPTASVREILKVPPLTPVPIAPVYVQGIFTHQGKIVPVIDVAKRFQGGGLSQKVPGYLLLCEVEGGVYGLLVDSVVDVASFPQNQILSLEEGDHPKIAKQYIGGKWKRFFAKQEKGFSHDFMIAGPQFHEKYPEDSGKREEEGPVFVLQLQDMIGSLLAEGVMVQ